MQTIRSGACRLCGTIAGPSRLPFQVIPRRSLFSTPIVHSGSNKWSKIKHKKGAADTARSQVYSRLTQDIHTALRPPNSHDPTTNTRLAVALALAKAKDGGLPKANVESCFARAKSAADGTGQSLTYEAMGPGGKEALIIECFADNPNRVFSKVREALNKTGFRITNVGFLFEKKGLVTLEPIEGETATGGLDEVFEIAVEAGAEDVKEVVGEEGESKQFEVYSASTDLNNVTNYLTTPDVAKSYNLVSSELAYIAMDPVPISEDGMGLPEKQLEVLMKAVSLLELEPDVVKVWTNVADE